MPISIAPGTFFAYRKPVMASPIMANSAGPEVISPSKTKVASSFTTTPAFCRPIKAINSPMPAPTAYLRFNGIALTIASRIFVIVRSINIRPSMNTAVSANCQEYPMPRHTVYTKNAFNPIPGARPNGSLPQNAMTRQPIMAAKAVEVNTDPIGMPSNMPNIVGFTARIYDIVRNVVIPASTSVRIEVTFGLYPNSFFNIVLI